MTALVKSYNVNSQTPDSAGTMSAIVTGVKTDIGVFGIDENVSFGDCASARGDRLTGAEPPVPYHVAGHDLGAEGGRAKQTLTAESLRPATL